MNGTWQYLSTWLGALPTLALLVSSAVGQENTSEACKRWNEYRIFFEAGSAKIDKDAVKGLENFVAAAGPACGYRIYATASDDGKFESNYALAGKRHAAAMKALQASGADDLKVVAMPYWVAEDEKDLKKARSAVIYTFPKQGIICSQADKRTASRELELWFDERSAVISPQRRRDLERFVKDIADTDCNVEVLAFAAKEIHQAKGELRRVNRQFARARAKAVEEALIAAGLEADRIVVRTTDYVGEKQRNVPRTRRAVVKLM